MKAVKEHLAKTDASQVEAFEKGAAAYAKKIIANFKDYEFVGSLILSKKSSFSQLHQYTSESMNPDGMVALLNYRVCLVVILSMMFCAEMVLALGGWCHPYVFLIQSEITHF